MVAAIANPQKGAGMFDLAERQAMIGESVAHLTNVTITSFNSLVVDLARDLGVDFIVKGLRAVSDFESEPSRPRRTWPSRAYTRCSCRRPPLTLSWHPG